MFTIGHIGYLAVFIFSLEWARLSIIYRNILVERFIGSKLLRFCAFPSFIINYLGPNLSNYYQIFTCKKWIFMLFSIVDVILNEI